jgi:hypothetical protein
VLRAKLPDFGVAMLEAENWKIAVSLYKDHPIPALLLAHQLTAIKQCLQRGRKGISDAIGSGSIRIHSPLPHAAIHASHTLIPQQQKFVFTQRVNIRLVQYLQKFTQAEGPPRKQK